MFAREGLVHESLAFLSRVVVAAAAHVPASPPRNRARGPSSAWSAIDRRRAAGRDRGRDRGGDWRVARNGGRQPGRFEFTLLPIGRYTIKVSLQGFGDSETKGIRLETQQNREVDVALRLAGVQESLTVTGTAQVVEVDRRSASLGQVINSEQVAELPLNGRNFVQLGTLGPGAVKGEGAFFNNKGTTEVSIRGSTSISVQGMRENANDFLIDGIDNNELTAGAVSILPSVESIREFKVLTNSYSAEYGSRGGGTVLVSTKSGANSFHGSGFEFLRNDKFDSKNYFEQQKGKFQQNQFGASLGGPIKKNKTFFFSDYMGFIIRQAQPVLATVPTAKMRAGEFTESLPGAPSRLIYDPSTTRVDPSTGRQIRDAFPNNQIPANRLDPIAVKLLASIRCPRSTIGWSDNYLANPIKEFNQNYVNARIDHTLSQADNLFGRVTFDHATQFYPYAFEYGRAGTYSTIDYLTKARNIALSETHIFSSRLLNQLTGGYNYVFNTMTPIGEGKNLSQQFGIPGANLGDPENSTLHADQSGARVHHPRRPRVRAVHRRHEGTPHLRCADLTRGAHTVKTGGSVRLMKMDTLGASAYAGAFSFDQFFTSQFGATGALERRNRSTDREPAARPAGQRQSFAILRRLHDDAAVERIPDLRRRHLAGALRPDAEPRPRLQPDDTAARSREPDGELRVRDRAVHHRQRRRPDRRRQDRQEQFEPRLGVSWSPGESKKLAIRAGYGVFHDVSGNGGVQGLVYNPPFVSELGFTSDSITPVRTLQTGFPVSPRPNPATYPGNLYLNELDQPQGTIQMWNLNVQQEFLRGTVWTVAYAGTRGRNIQSKGWNLNSAPPGPGFNTASRRPYPQYNTFNAILGRGEIDYKSLQFKAEKRFTQGSYLLVGYTWGKALTNGAGQNVGVGQGVRYYPYEPFPDADLGRSDTDIRHAFNLSYIAALPFGHGQRWMSSASGVKQALLGDWQLNGIIRARTGLPLAMSLASNQNGTALGNRPDQTAAENCRRISARRPSGSTRAALSRRSQVSSATRLAPCSPGPG